MKHVFVLILAICVPFSFSGCAKMKGQRIEFGHSFPCKQLRGHVYYITFKEDLPRILAWKERVSETGDCNGRPSEASGLFYRRCGENSYHYMLQNELEPYYEGFFGWF